MISFIKGKIIDLSFNNAVILTNSWIGYDIWINELIYSKIGLNEEISLYIYHHMTENSDSLFWFLEKVERDVFTWLLKVPWIWWKTAMQIMSLWAERLVLAINSNDNKTLEWIKWIGKKMAEKIIIELKDKDFWINISSKEWILRANSLSSDLHISIKATLSNMWYNPRDVDNILNKLPEWMREASEVIPYIIKELS